MSSGMCYGCASKFGFFNEQLGCKNCGFAFCKKCLTKTAAVPKLKNKKAPVCNKCHDVLKGNVPPQSAAEQVVPPDALAKRIAAAKEAEQKKAEQAKSKSSQKVSAKYKGMSPEDVALAERLAKLRQNLSVDDSSSKKQHSSPSLPSDEEIAKRLALVKGQPPSTVPTEEEMAKRLALMKGQPTVPTEEEMAKRLAVIRGQDPEKINQPVSLQPSNHSLTHPDQVSALLDEICEEVNLDTNYATGQSGGYKSDSNEPNSLIRNASDDQNGTSLSEMDILIRKMADELHIDAERAIEGLKKDKELWDRLKRVKKSDGHADQENQNGGISGNGSKEDSDSDDEEALTKRLVRQMMEEKFLDDASPASPSHNSRPTNKTHIDGIHKDKNSESNETDELPWCCICNKDAVLRCSGCDGDLYCQRCYREGHDRRDMKTHRTQPYQTVSSKK